MYERHLTTDKLDGFLAGSMLLGSTWGEDIYVDGSLSEKLYYNLDNYYLRIAALSMAAMRTVRIIPKDLDDGSARSGGTAVATGFSAGVDSKCTVALHTRPDIPPRYRLTHLVYINVGAHGPRLSEAKVLFKSRRAFVEGFAADMGLELIVIDSNLHSVLQMPMRNTHVPRNISAALLLQGLFGKYLYTADHPLEDWLLYNKVDPRYIDPATVHLLSTETMECVSTGCQFSRVERTDIASRHPVSHKYLNVCLRPGRDGKNCSRCEKCMRTQFTLEMLGRLDRYRGVFDLRSYRKARSEYLLQVLSSKRDSFNREILEYASNAGYRLPVGLVLAGAFLSPFAWSLRALMEAGRSMKRSACMRLALRSAGRRGAGCQGL
jgi:hypothetical protein